MSDFEIRINVSPDEFRASADFYPAKGNGIPLKLKFVESALSTAGIIHGIKWNTIESAILYCNTENKGKKDVEIALGTLPTSAIPEHWNLSKGLFQQVMGYSKNDTKIDYKERSPFVMVKKGDVIAKFVEARPGVEGKGVKGNPIPFKMKDITQFQPGKKTIVSKGNLFAATSGKYEIDEAKNININDVLHIEGNVDYSTGNISFGKDVIIEGEIKDGFTVAVGGSLNCKKNLDASDILCRKDLSIAGGIIGHGTALVRAGGIVSTRFIENCDVESKSDILVEKNIMNSKICTLGKLILGSKSVILSTEIYAEKGIETHKVGKSGSPISELFLGISFVEKRSLDALKQRLDVLKDKLNRLGKLPSNKLTEKKLKLKEQIEEVIEKGELEVKKKELVLNKNPDATLLVTGKITQGNIVYICGEKYIVAKELSKIKFYLNRENNSIETSPL